MKALKVLVPTRPRAYEIVIGQALLADPAVWNSLETKALALVVTNSTIAPLYLDRLRNTLATRFAAVHAVQLPDGEEHKVWQSVESIVDALLERNADRHCMLVALGGGVIGDLTGFAAACYMRGVDYVQVPTTLLAQVDSSVGGKTAINHARGKNMVGAFHQPVRVISDIDTLATLPAREVIAGLAEVIKYGAIADESFLVWLESNIEALLGRDAPALTHAIQRSCEIKAAVVAADERESGLRAHLNFGHTFGHAIEAALGYGTWLHGEAVGCGMVLAADLSRRLGTIDAARSQRIADLVRRAGLPTHLPPVSAERLLDSMRVDKKREGASIRFVLLDGQAKARVQTVDDAVLREVIRDFSS